MIKANGKNIDSKKIVYSAVTNNNRFKKGQFGNIEKDRKSLFQSFDEYENNLINKMDDDNDKTD